MKRVVVDASVAVKWFVPEVYATAARRLLREGMNLLAPDLIWTEVGNVLWRKWRAGELEAEAAFGILNDFRRFPLQIYRSDTLYEAAWQVAQGSGRTFYDSLYLALAASTGSLLVTADQRLYHSLCNSPWGQYCSWVEDETLAA